MASKIKISGDTSELKKSILDVSKSLKDLKGSKVSVFSSEDKKFFKGELRREITLMKQKLSENRAEISKMIKEQSKLIKGSDEELQTRKKILEAYKTQTKLARELGDAQKMSKDIPGGGGGMGGLLGSIGKFAGMGALATGAFALLKGVQATSQYVAGTPNRVKLKGLGVNDENFGSPEELARVGLSEQDMIDRRIQATKILGRQGTSNESEMRKAGFERAYGLDSGTMTNVAGSFRAQVGGQQATDMQLKLQASIMAAGIEDALGPYLDSAVQLLTSINDTGTANTAELTSLFAQLAKDGERTPELISKTFQNIDSAIKGATGESSAFLQTAFARAGIGGQTVGGTKFAMSSGGISGLSKDELAKRGYNPELLANMEKNGMFSGVGKRSDAILSQFREAGGLKVGEKISGVTDMNRMVGLNDLANNVFGTKGNQGFDVLMMLEKVQNKQMSQKQFDAKLKEMQDAKDPSVARLDKINSTLAGQTDILTNINTNLMEALGKQGVVVRNAATKVENEGISSATDVASAVNSTGVVDGSGTALQNGIRSVKTGVGSKLYDWFRGGSDQKKLDDMTSDEAIAAKRREMQKVWNSEQSSASNTKGNQFPTAKEIGKEVADALKKTPITPNVNVKSNIHLPDGKVTERTNR